ncbi:hypothetical protein D9757_009547 [Collybiopsis confluens]|uniref:Uncharacterized protein n=1 Tax=Collybiopsis confluens TaxID=2823264 RepID=A0A8H5M2T3_9AGAR|nr:hypothetical protein D9757_009547 [Collybiopsis confluens]
MSTKCHQKIKLTDKGQQRLRKAPRLSEDRDIADALGTDTQSNVEQNVAGPAPARTPSPVPYPPLPPPAPPPPPSLVTLRPTRSGRTRFLPARFQDNLPTLSRSMPSTFQPENPIEEPAPAPVPAPFPSPTPEPDIVLKKVRTDPDQFGIFRIYSELPKSIPDEEVPIEDVCEGAGFPVPPPADSSSIFGSVIKVSSRVKNSIIAPFLNITVWRLMSWWYNSDTKSIADLDCLVKEVIHPSDFDPSHLEGFSTDKVLKDLDNYQDDTRLFPAEDGWREISVEIPVPCRGVKQPEAKAPRYIISGIFIRKPLEVMKSTFQSSLTEKFHYTPFELRQESFPGSPSSFRLHGELYNSPAFIEEHNRVQVEQFKKGKASPENKDLQYPTALAGMMLWSDATRVGHWGDATMWPIYMYFGNQSKYDRSRPSAFAAHHIAYIPKLSEDFKGWYQEQYGCTPTEAVMTFMRREIPHAIYAELFDKDFMNAYRDGIILRCGNKVTRSMFPRLFTWSADYPEKMLLICCKCLGLHPCGECNISKDKIFRLGTVLDRGTRDRLRRQDSELRQNKVERARELIFKKGYSISSKAIDYLLGDHSWTPTRNTFSTLFYKFGFNFYNIIVSDVLHEFELGVWKAVLTHLIRILNAIGKPSVEEMNQRFRKTPTFGRDTIRKINKNVSLLQNLAARDYEDFLQVSLPVLEGLFGIHDKNVQDLLFNLTAVHSFAKLRLHSDPALQTLDQHTTQLGKSLRTFKNHVCPDFATKELAKEAGARERRRAKQQERQGAGNKGKEVSQKKADKTKMFSLSTYKVHAIGSYTRFISLFGTTDSYSTQVGELEHRRIKRFYSRTNKVFRYVRQVTNQERRVRIVKSIERRLEDQQKSKAAEAENSKIQDSSNPRIPFEHEDPLPIADPTSHYQVSMTRSHRLPIMPWLDKHEDDLAVNHFLRKLRTHVFCRLTGECDEESVTPSDRGRVFINNNDRMYVHKVLRINYTTYDQRRCQDSINPRTHSDVMVLSPNDVDDDEPYLYARVIGIYHVEAGLRNDPQNSSSKRIDFLWVRWYVSADDRSCWKSRRLPQVGFVDGSDDGAFGFLDPAQVIRAVHLLPNFKEGRVSTILGPSMARRADEEDQDYQRYYINIFADRDMMIRFCPELTLGTHIASVVPDPPDSSDIEDNSDSSEEIEEEEEEQDEETLDDASHSEGESDRESIDSDRYTEGEGSDYGYDTGGSDEEDVENIEDNQFDVEPNIGPEDGKEPFNHDVEILDIEGFSAL